MGKGLSWICPNCGYEFSAVLGLGFRYPRVCHQLVQKARAGAYGAEWQDLVETYPGTFLDGDRVLLRCENCGSYDNEALLTAYIPKDAELQAKPIPEKQWTVPEKEGYELYGVYEHRCKDCGGKMRVFLEQELFEKKDDEICPRCKTALKLKDFYWWD
jgi:hypothetical protein